MKFFYPGLFSQKVFPWTLGNFFFLGAQKSFLKEEQRVLGRCEIYVGMVDGRRLDGR